MLRESWIFRCGNEFPQWNIEFLQIATQGLLSLSVAPLELDSIHKTSYLALYLALIPARLDNYFREHKNYGTAPRE